MTNDAVLVLQCLFQTIWRLFTSWHIPGTNVTPAMFFFFLAAAGIGLTFVLRFLGIGGGVSVSQGYRGMISVALFDKENNSSGKGD